MFPQGILSQAYVMSALVGGGFLIFNFVMGHMDDSSDDAGHHGHDFGHDGDDGGGHADHDGGEGHSDHHEDTSRYSLVTDHRVQYRVGRFVLSVLSPISISIFLAFSGLCGYAVGYLFPGIGYFTLIPAVLAGFAMINIFKSMIAAMMRYGTSSTHLRSDDLIGHVAEVLIPIAENRPGEVTYVIQSKIYSSVARSKPGTAINKGTKVMIVERDGPIVFVEPYKNLLIEDGPCDAWFKGGLRMIFQMSPDIVQGV